MASSSIICRMQNPEVNRAANICKMQNAEENQAANIAIILCRTQKSWNQAENMQNAEEYNKTSKNTERRSEANRSDES